MNVLQKMSTKKIRDSIQAVFLPVHFFRNLFVVGILIVSFGDAVGQIDDSGPRRGSKIINDTLKQVYGPKTSRYYYEDDVFFNRTAFHFIDTVIQNFHRFSYVQKKEYQYQDLGNIGTDSRSIFYKVPKYIGANSGHEEYDLYWEADKIRYFDTKSPYSNLNLTLGGKGRSIANIAFSRNINPRWNFGFDIRSLAVDKQVQRSGKGDRNMRSMYYDLYTTYQTKDSTYRVFFNFARNRLMIDEFGGVNVEDENNRKDYFDKNRQPFLTEAESRELRMNVHLFHQYEIRRALQLYHKFDRGRQGNQFIDDPSAAPDGYYDHVEIDSVKTHDEVKFTTVRNEVGVKGNLSKLFYNGYYAIRHYGMDYKYINSDTLVMEAPARGTESYLGGKMEIQLDSIFLLSGWAEVLLNEGNYRVEGSLKSKWLEVTLKENSYSPGFMQLAYRGSHDVWNNNFKPIDVTQLNGYLHYRSKKFHIAPGLTFTRLNNYVYFKQDLTLIPQTVLPVQSSENHIIFSPEIKLSTTFKNITLRGNIIFNYMVENSDNAITLPDVFANAQLSYANIFFGGNFDIHFGLDAHWQNDYYAMGFDVPTQQFYTQNSFLSPAFPIVDAFFNARIIKGRIFVKYNNLIQAITGEGYFPTPLYPGQSNIIDFGFDWSFYD